MSENPEYNNEWEERFASRDQTAKLMRRALRVRIFGPYLGDCSYILSDAARQVRSRNDYDAQLCLDIPEVDPLYRYKCGASTERYNLEASLECLHRADFAVFVFMKSKKQRFISSYPREFDNYDGDRYFEEPDLPQDLNSSAIVEYTKWTDSDPRGDKCLVIYEENMRSELGSLVHGLSEREDIACNNISASSRRETVHKIGRAIAGHCRTWFDDYHNYLLDLASPHPNG